MDGIARRSSVNGETQNAVNGRTLVSPTQRYTLRMSTILFIALQKMATEHNTTVLELIQKAVKLLLILVKEEASGGTLVLRKGDTEKQVILL